MHCAARGSFAYESSSNNCAPNHNQRANSRQRVREAIWCCAFIFEGCFGECDETSDQLSIKYWLCVLCRTSSGNILPSFISLSLYPLLFSILLLLSSWSSSSFQKAITTTALILSGDIFLQCATPPAQLIDKFWAHGRDNGERRELLLRGVSWHSLWLIN